MTDPRLAELDWLEREGGEDDIDRILDLLAELGDDANGLHLLVDRYGASGNEPFRGMLAIVLSRACWVWDFEDERLPAVVLRFAGMVARTSTPGTLVSTLGAVQGLSRRGVLRAGNDDERAAFGDFVLDCVSRDDWFVLTTLIQTLVHVHCEDKLLEPLLGQETRRALAARLAEMSDDPEHAGDLEPLQPFWAD